MSEFVEVYVLATGRTEVVPAHFIGDPVLGVGIEKTPAQKVIDGEIESVVPTDTDSVETINDFAADAGIDLAGARTKKEKVAVIAGALGESAAELPAGNPDVQLAGPISDLPWIPTVRAAVLAARTTTDTGGTQSSDETPAVGEQEN